MLLHQVKNLSWPNKSFGIYNKYSYLKYLKQQSAILNHSQLKFVTESEILCSRTVQKRVINTILTHNQQKIRILNDLFKKLFYICTSH